MRLVVVALLCLTGCFDARPPDGVIACGEAGCPPGLQCAADGFCWSSPPGLDGGEPDAPIAADGGIDASHDGGPTGACSSVSMLADDFEDGTFGDQWGRSYGSGTSRLEQDGMAVFPVEGQTWSAYASTYDYDLTGGSVTVRVVDVGVGPDIYTFMGVRNKVAGDDPVARVIHFEGQVYAETRIDGVSDRYGPALTYDPDQHRYWRIREADGLLHWEVSPDGSTWTELASREPWFDVTHVQADLGVGTDSSSPPATTARFDDFNGGVAIGEACATSTVVDDFADPDVTSAQFNEWTSGACAGTVAAGGANVALAGTGAGECMWVTRRGLDLRGDHVTVEVEQAASGADEYTYLGIQSVDGGWAHVLTYDGMLYVSTVVDGVTDDLVAVPYAPNLQRYWRLRVTGGRLYGEVSAGGLNWVSTDMGTPFPLDDLRVYIGAGVDLATGTAAAARFDDFNILP
jgi:hypothetical protein